MGRQGVAQGAVLDSGALIGLERGDERSRGLIRTFRERGSLLIVPAPVLAQVWRDGARQARIAKLIRAPGTVVDALDEYGAKAVGVVLGRSGTSDVVDGSVVVAARRHRAVAVTGNAADLQRIDPRLAVEEL